MNQQRVRLTFEVDYALLATKGFDEATRSLRLTDDGEVIIPLDLGGGLVMGNPAPCGTWEVV